jgi:hypothetical protein
MTVTEYTVDERCWMLRATCTRAFLIWDKTVKYYRGLWSVVSSGSYRPEWALRATVNWGECNNGRQMIAPLTSANDSLEGMRIGIYPANTTVSVLRETGSYRRILIQASSPKLEIL